MDLLKEHKDEAKWNHEMKIIMGVREPVLWVALILAVAVAAWGCQPKAEREAQSAPLKLILAVQPAPYSGLIAVAAEKGFFRESGVEVTIRPYPSGLEALRAMQHGDAMVSTVGDIAFAGQMSKDPSVRVVASIGLTVGNQVVARKDRNIREPSDLKGKKIGYSPGTSSDYFLHAFLLTNHLSPADIRKVGVPAARQVQAVVTGEVDAVSAFEIYAFVAREQLGENAVSWETQNNLCYQWLLAARENFTQTPEAIKRLLKALIKAEDFVLTNQDETKRIIARKWDFSPEYIEQSWSRTRLNVSFNQSIVTSLQNYSKWEMERDGKTWDRPDILNFLYTGALDEIDPGLVTIFR